MGDRRRRFDDGIGAEMAVYAQIAPCCAHACSGNRRQRDLLDW
jgi:hypothetical protein